MSKTQTSRPTIVGTTTTAQSSAGTSFNLRSLVREVAANSTLRDPGALAEEVAKHIPAEHVAEALRQCLRVFVRQIVSEDRPHGSVGRAGISPPVQSSRSSKVSAIRDGWQRQLRARYAVGDGAWEFLGECTREHLTFIATELDKQASQKEAKARGMRGLAAALEEHEVERVKDLPAELLMNSLGAAA